LKIDGAELTQDNYLDLYDKSSFTVSLGGYNGSGIYETDEEIYISNNNIELNPIIHSEILETDGIKIGYLVYVDFVSGSEDALLKKLGEILEGFRSEGIDELVVDLRYNRGGNVDAAQYFGSLLAPQTQVINRDVFVRFDYNDILEKYYHDREGENSSHLYIRFKDVGYHLDLDRILFLTSSHTASASELVMVGLDPYMEVISIGEPTFGKFYGSFVIYDEQNPPRHNWAIVPVVLKYTNANGFTDFVDGVTPDYYVADNLLEAKPFGDPTDPMMAQAISYITGNPVNQNVRIGRAKSYDEMVNWKKIRKGNILQTSDRLMMELEIQESSLPD
jgi:C-terminal processing protease CtpA/Prc